MLSLPFSHGTRFQVTIHRKPDPKGRRITIGTSLGGGVGKKSLKRGGDNNCDHQFYRYIEHYKKLVVPVYIVCYFWLFLYTSLCFMLPFLPKPTVSPFNIEQPKFFTVGESLERRRRMAKAAKANYRMVCEAEATSHWLKAFAVNLKQNDLGKSQSGKTKKQISSVVIPLIVSTTHSTFGSQTFMYGRFSLPCSAAELMCKPRKTVLRFGERLTPKFVLPQVNALLHHMLTLHDKVYICNYNDREY